MSTSMQHPCATQPYIQTKHSLKTRKKESGIPTKVKMKFFSNLKECVIYNELSTDTNISCLSCLDQTPQKKPLKGGRIYSSSKFKETKPMTGRAQQQWLHSCGHMGKLTLFQQPCNGDLGLQGGWTVILRSVPQSPLSPAKLRPIKFQSFSKQTTTWDPMCQPVADTSHSKPE